MSGLAPTNHDSPDAVAESWFHVPGMDCAAEEHVVRMRLDGLPAVRRVDVDLSRRTVRVEHDGEDLEIVAALASLGFGARVAAAGGSIATHVVAGSRQATPAGAGAAGEGLQRRVLWAVLIINAAFFAFELVAGLLADSMGLVADSLDMLADALVYGMSLAAVGGALARKKRVALAAGLLQSTLAVFGFVEVVRRFLALDVLPDAPTMIGVSSLALVANAVSLLLLHRARSSDAHIRASMIFTSNDVVINLGVIAAAVLVSVLASPLPDLAVGAAVFAIVMRGALRILRLAA